MKAPCTVSSEEAGFLEYNDPYTTQTEDKMAENKTQPTGESVEGFLNGIENEKRRQDSFKVLELMQEITGLQPRMWGGSIVGLGETHLQYESGRQLEWFQVGFSPRKANLTLYLNTGFERYGELLAKLGKYTTGKSCLYIKKIEDIDLEVLKELVRLSVQDFSREN